MMTKTISMLAVCALASLIALTPVNAQEGEPALQPLTEEVSASFDQLLANIEDFRKDIKELDGRSEGFDGIIAQVLAARRDKLWTSKFQSTMALARAVALEKDNGKDVSAYWDQLAKDLRDLPDDVYGTLERIRSRVEFPSAEMPPEEFVVADQKLFSTMREVDNLFSELVIYTQIADDFGINASSIREDLVEEISDAAANRSVFLELAINDVNMLRSSVATLPGNSNLADWLNAADTRVRSIAVEMNQSIAVMNSLNLNTRQYRQQVLKVTGEITTDVLDVGIATELLSEWGSSALRLISEQGPKILFRLLLAVFIFFVFVQLAKLIQKGVDKGLHSDRFSMSHLLHRMIVSIVRNVIVIIGALIAIQQLGISLAPLLAGIGIIGFIIGFALQDSLANFASGIMILMYRPFDVGDLVEAGGVSGRVSHMSLVNTSFKTLDNQKLIVPNNIIWQSVIINVTAQRTRRIDLVFGISYGDDIEKAERVLREVVAADERVLDDPKPDIRVHALGESSVDFVVRPWVKTGVYWEAYGALTKAVKIAFDKEGISIPFPQRDVHVIEQK